ARRSDQDGWAATTDRKIQRIIAVVPHTAPKRKKGRKPYENGAGPVHERICSDSVMAASQC
ncbi:hypothetical protein LCGC14_1735400, partial [marine sediment metagenome]